MRQVLVIHGGDSFATYEEYLESLRQQEVHLESLRGWKSGLGEALGDDYQVITPRMPNAFNALYEEWKIWFEKYLALLDDDLILVGHSLGGSFLAKYLAITEISKKIRGTFLIAPPHHTDAGREVVEFDSPDSLDLLASQGGTLFLYHSKDDPIVDFSELAEFSRRLPNAHVHVFEDRGHFLGEEFPEIVQDIMSLG